MICLQKSCPLLHFIVVRIKIELEAIDRQQLCSSLCAIVSSQSQLESQCVHLTQYLCVCVILKTQVLNL